MAIIGERLSPSYDSDLDDDDDDVDDEELETDEGAEETKIDSMTTSPFGQAPTTPSWGNSSGWSKPTPPSSPWVTQPNNTTPTWGSGQSNSSPWSSTATPAVQREPINRGKKVIFCDFLDCIVETYQSNGVPGLLPRDIYDLKPRFDVWSKLSAFGAERIYAVIPKNLIPSTNGASAWSMALSYYCCCLSSFLRLPYQSCQILAQSVIGQPKEDIIKSMIFNTSCPIPQKDVVCVGIYSGLNGQSDRDIRAARSCGVDYIDLPQLLNNMY